MSDNQEIGKRLGQAREALSISRTEAAEAFDTPYQTYAAHENGNRGIPRAAMEKYARKFGVTADWLLTGKGHAPKVRPKPDLSLPDWQLAIKYVLQDALDRKVDRQVIASFLVDEVARLLAEVAHERGADVSEIVRNVRTSADAQGDTHKTRSRHQGRQ